MRFLLATIRWLLPVLLLVSGGIPARADDLTAGADRTPHYGYRVIRSYPSDPQAFTQGLIYHDGFLYKSTGLYGRSSLRRIDLETGAILQRHNLAGYYFAEGLARWGKTLVQLTWQNRTGILYDLDTFEQRGTFRFAGEGWGLTSDGRHLIMSNGSAELQFLDPDTFSVVHRITVRDRHTTVEQLNELEYIDGEIWANIWNSDRLVRIDPVSGQVTGWVDLAGLRPDRVRPDTSAVLNGIAYDAAGQRLFVTGKRWPAVFQIELSAPQRSPAPTLSD